METLNNVTAAAVGAAVNAVNSGPAVAQQLKKVGSMSQAEIDNVARDFVLQYYTMMSMRPELLHCFYTKASSLIRCARRPAIGQREIHGLLMDIQADLRGSKAAVFSVDALPSFANQGILIQVAGEISANQSGVTPSPTGLAAAAASGATDQSPSQMRRFMQSFLLIESEAGNFYVNNDIFQFQDGVFRPPTPPPAVSCQQPIREQQHCWGAEEAEHSSGEVVAPQTPSATGAAAATAAAANENEDTTLRNVVVEAPPHVNMQHQQQQQQHVVVEQPSQTGTNTVQQQQQQPGSMTQSHSQNATGGSAAVAATSGGVVEVDVMANASVANSAGAGIADHSGAPPSSANSTPAAVTVTADNSVAGVAQQPQPQEPISWSKMITIKQKPMASVIPQRPINSAAAHMQHTQNMTSSVSANTGNASKNVDEARSSPAFSKQQQQIGASVGAAANQQHAQSQMANQQQLHQHAGEAEMTGQKRNAAGGGGSMVGHTTGGGSVAVPDKYQLFVGNLPHMVSKKQLHDVFSKYGRVVDLRIQKSRQFTRSGSNLPNFGFVSFDSEAPVKEILKQRPFIHNGQRYNVEEKKPSSGGAANGGAGGGANQQQMGGVVGNTNEFRYNNNSSGMTSSSGRQSTALATPAGGAASNNRE